MIFLLPPPVPDEGGRRLQVIERRPRIPVGRSNDVPQGLFVDFELQFAEPLFPVADGPPENGLEFLLRVGFQNHHPCTRQQGCDDLEGGVFRRCADEGDETAFDVREKGVLLSLVETVDLVDEQDGSSTVEFPLGPRFLDDGSDLFEAGKNGGEGLEMRPGLPGHDPGQGGFPRPRGTPEDDGEQAVLLYGASEEAVRAEEMRLPHEVRECPRPHPFRQRGRRVGPFAGRLIEQIHPSKLRLRLVGHSRALKVPRTPPKNNIPGQRQSSQGFGNFSIALRALWSSSSGSSYFSS